MLVADVVRTELLSAEPAQDLIGSMIAPLKNQHKQVREHDAGCALAIHKVSAKYALQGSHC